ncbi:unnamed protein product [Pseudo-nitzschia multistriata]|uniref:Uncharacterized protein n=1 Tax=Pseudo-nitzschia multistriata TaxID=183589 RepID=A0A448ZBG0_9STRA|nr:unnamed protein product [Pseudo-nitzschia multistriata]
MQLEMVTTSRLIDGPSTNSGRSVTLANSHPFSQSQPPSLRRLYESMVRESSSTDYNELYEERTTLQREWTQFLESVDVGDHNLLDPIAPQTSSRDRNGRNEWPPSPETPTAGLSASSCTLEEATQISLMTVVTTTTAEDAHLVCSDESSGHCSACQARSQTKTDPRCAAAGTQLDLEPEDTEEAMVTFRCLNEQVDQLRGILESSLPMAAGFSRTTTTTTN